VPFLAGLDESKRRSGRSAGYNANPIFAASVEYYESTLSPEKPG
jgi:hypothetical protein